MGATPSVIVPQTDSEKWTVNYHAGFKRIHPVKRGPDRPISHQLEEEVDDAEGEEDIVLDQDFGRSPPPPVGSAVQTKRKSGSIRWSTPTVVMKNFSDMKHLKLTFELDEFRQTALEAINEYRAIHGSSALVLDAELNGTAQLWADTLAKDHTFTHTTSEQRKITRGKVGENLCRILNCPTNFNPGRNYIDVNYKLEQPLYDFITPGFSKATGTFAQMVWRDSACVGLGVAHVQGEKKQTVLVVEHYYPTGNVTGKFEWNVLPADSTKEDVDKIMTLIRSPCQMNYKQLNKFREQNMKTHNMYRQLHGSAPLKLDEELCELAQSVAERIALTKEFKRSEKDDLTLPRGLVGESIDRIGFVTSVYVSNGRNAVNRIYRAIENFNFLDKKHREETDGVEQILWRSTRCLGVGSVKYYNGRGLCSVTVHHYFPARDEDYETNIFPLGLTTGQVDAVVEEMTMRRSGLSMVGSSSEALIATQDLNELSNESIESLKGSRDKVTSTRHGDPSYDIFEPTPTC